MSRISLVLILLTFIACNKISILSPGKIYIKSKKGIPQIRQIKVENDQIIIHGANLLRVSAANIQGDSNHNFIIESRSDNSLILNARSNLSLLVGGTFNLIISSAQGAATYPITFELQNGQVTAAKLHNMGATSGQVLRFNGTNWAPTSIQSSLIYTGTYNANTDLPDIVSAGGPAGTFYIVTVGGTQDLGSGPETFSVGDWAIFDGTIWSRIPMSGNAVSSFNGRTGIVVPLANDYSWTLLAKTSGKLTGSRLSEIADVSITGIQNGDVLSWDQTSSQWIASPPTVTIAAGSVTSTEIASGAVNSSKIVDGSIVNADISATAAISQSKIQNLTTDLAAKEASISAGTNVQYFRGDKSWQTLNTTAVAEGTNLYFLDSRVRSTLMSGYTMGTAVPIDVTDTLSQAIGKLEAQITAGGSNWSKTGTTVYYNGGNVGIATATPLHGLEVHGNVSVGKGPSNVTTLSSNINASVTTIPVTSTAGFANSGLLSINGELVQYANKNATQFLNVVRGYGLANGVGSSHSSTDPVKGISFSVDQQNAGDNPIFGISNDGGVVFGHGQSANGWNIGEGSLVGGYASSAVGPNSIALGNFVQAQGNNSQAFGYHTVAGDWGFAVGDSTLAGGYVGFAAGSNTVTSGDYTTAFGVGTLASSYGSFSLGRYNVGGGTAGSWVATDFLFEIGNGSAAGARANALTVLKNGSVGIGLSSPQARLDVADSSTTSSAIILPRAATFTGTNVNGMIRYNTDTSLFEFRQNGSWVNFTTVSDSRLKTNIKPVSNGLDIVNKLNPVYYDWDRKNTKTKGFEDKHQIGLIAQEVEKLLPEVVNNGENNYKSVEYGKIVAVAIAAIKEVNRELKGLNDIKADKSELLKLKAENEKLRKENSEIRYYICGKDPQSVLCR